jgi:hypothetical protein
MNEEERKAFIDARRDQMTTTRSAFECAVEFGSWDLAEDAFDTAMQLAWEALMLHMVDADEPLIDPTKVPDMTRLMRGRG